MNDPYQRIIPIENTGVSQHINFHKEIIVNDIYGFIGTDSAICTVSKKVVRKLNLTVQNGQTSTIQFWLPNQTCILFTKVKTTAKIQVDHEISEDVSLLIVPGETRDTDLL